MKLTRRGFIGSAVAALGLLASSRASKPKVAKPYTYTTAAETGIKIRHITFYDPSRDLVVTRIDTLCGFSVIPPVFTARIQS